MRRIFIPVLLALSAAAFAQQTLTLQEALEGSAEYLTGRMPGGSAVAVFNFSAPTKEISDYAVTYLTTYLVNTGMFTVLDRRDLELLQREHQYQMSGEVDDAAMQSIGKKIGAEILVLGSLSPLGTNYSVEIKVTQVQTAQIIGSQTTTVRPDNQLRALLRQPFSTERRISAGFLNLALGAGSFSMGDWGGGLTLAGGYAAAAGLIIWELSLNPHDPKANIPGTVGLGIAGVTAIYGFIRPFIYRRATPEWLGGVRITVLPDTKGVPVMWLSYRMSF
jgi:hypothetical protein